MEEEKPVDVVGAEGGNEEGAADKKKKKKKKPAADKDKPAVKDDKGKKEPARKGGPSKKQIAAIQEAIQKAKEEEERLRREEDEKFRLQEEAENARLEKLRLEQERKERKKQKEKEKIQRLKAEGKFLTQKQKEKMTLEKQRAQEMLEAMKAQGIELRTETAVDKKPRLGTRVRTKKSNSTEAAASSTQEASQEGEQELNEEAKEEEQKLETQASAEEEDVKDEWDATSSEEEDDSKENSSPAPPSKVVPRKANAPLSQGNNVSRKLRHSSSENGGKGESVEDSDSEDSSDDSEHTMESKREKALRRIQKRREENERTRSLQNLRSPVVCVLGHVDTGKTKILDKLRRTHVQDGEAGGITQQIGATNVPIDAIKEQCKNVKEAATLDMKIPGLLIIDTPGHESFSNLRSRGSSLCDIAILVVDIMHGLEPQTIESINLLKSKKTPFVVALNKIDRLYEWNATGAKRDVRDVIAGQAKNTFSEFEKRAKEVVAQFAIQGLNTALLGQNPDPKTYITMVPTSALTGEGMGNLMALIVEFSQTMLAKQLMFSNELLATVLEVKAIPGLGTTVDVVLLNGKLAEGDTLVLAGSDGPIVTQIRSLLTPQPMKELRVKSSYIEYKEIQGAVGVKIAAKDLEKAIAGLNVLVANNPDEIEICKEEVTRELKTALSSFKLQERGVYVQASTLGSLEALLEFLRTSEIPYSGIRIGPVVKKDVMRASAMLEHDSKFALILAFDVKIERDAQELADSVGVKIFQADIIYHLFDKFTAYRDELKAKQRDEFKHLAIFPCKVKILPQCIFKTRDPIIVGVMVEAGIIKEGTPLCVINQTEIVDLGRVASIESNHKPVTTARKGQEVCIKIENTGDAPKMLGRHFQDTDMLVSKISRESIDVCKEYFRSDLEKSDWQLMVELKKMFQIM